MRKVPVQYAKSVFRGGQDVPAVRAEPYPAAGELRGYDPADLRVLDRHPAGIRSRNSSTTRRARRGSAAWRTGSTTSSRLAGRSGRSGRQPWILRRSCSCLWSASASSTRSSCTSSRTSPRTCRSRADSCRASGRDVRRASTSCACSCGSPGPARSSSASSPSSRTCRRTGSTSTRSTISSTGLLIVVGVVLDTMKQLEAQLLMRNYEGFIR